MGSYTRTRYKAGAVGKKQRLQVNLIQEKNDTDEQREVRVGNNKDPERWRKQTQALKSFLFCGPGSLDPLL